MDHRLWAKAGARVLAMMFIVAGVTACGERLGDSTANNNSGNSATGLPSNASPSAVVIGQAPAEPQAQPSGDTAQTTAPAGARGDVSARAESVARPLEGDNHSYSTLAPNTPQKADGTNDTGAYKTDNQRNPK
jgi:hypothetical protein